jgi:hypothetical protein
MVVPQFQQDVSPLASSSIAWFLMFTATTNGPIEVL